MRVAIERRDPIANTVDIWLANLGDGMQVRVVDGTYWVGMPLWSSAGDRILFTDWTGTYSIKVVRDENVQKLATATDFGGWPMGWSSDGGYIIFGVNDARTLNDVWYLPVADGTVALPYLRSPNSERDPALSPDGRWMAYASDESNEFEIYIESFPERGNKERISLAGGRRPGWGRAGRELYYIGGNGMFIAAPVSVGSSGLEVTERQPLFRAPRLILEDRLQYQVLGGGERFLFNEVAQTVPRFVTVINHWTSLVEQ